MNVMRKYLLQHLKKLICAIVIVVTYSLISIIPAKLTQQLIDFGFVAKDLRYIIICSLCIGVIGIIKSGLSFVSIKQFSNIGHTIVANLRNDIFDKVLNFPIDFFAGKDSGYISSRINEVSKISSLFNPNNVKFLAGVIEAIFALVILSTMNIQLLLLCCVPMGIYIAISVYSTKNYKKIIDDALEIDAKYAGKLNETIKGQEEIRINNGKKQEQDKVHSYSEKIKSRAIKQAVLLGGTTELLTVVTTLVSVFIYIICGIFVVKDQLTLGEMIAFSQYTGKLYTPILGFSSVVLIVQPALQSIKRIQETFCGINPPVSSGNKTITAITELEIKNLCYHYPSRQREVIKNLSFSIKGPTLCYIKGANGSGKTTLAKLLLKLIDEYSGQINVNGTELKQISESFYRGQCAAVSQKVFLFNDTVYNNIVYGMSNVTRERYQQVIQLSGLDVVLAVLPDGEKTIVGENGTRLSGGEKQKVAIARALLKDANVIILDEPSNNLDKASLSELRNLLKRISSEKIVIVIDHNDVFEDVATSIVNL